MGHSERTRAMHNAYDKGQLAFKQGKSVKDNPYDVTARYGSYPYWKLGYQHAKAAVKSKTSSGEGYCG